jgi:hypothetical protein
MAGFSWVPVGYFLGFLGFFLGFRRVAEAEFFRLQQVNPARRGCASGGPWIKAPEQRSRRPPARSAPHPRGAPQGRFQGIFFFVDAAQGPEADVVDGQAAEFASVAQSGAQDMGVNQSLGALVRLALEVGGFGWVGAGRGLLRESWHVNGDRLECPPAHSLFDGRTPRGAAPGRDVDSKRKTLIWLM